MKTEKMSFKNIKDVLSRDEMKKIMAGSVGGQGCGTCQIYTTGTNVPTTYGCVYDEIFSCTCVQSNNFC